MGEMCVQYLLLESTLIWGADDDDDDDDDDTPVHAQRNSGGYNSNHSATSALDEGRWSVP